MKVSFFNWKVAVASIAAILFSLLAIFNITALFGRLESVTDQVRSNKHITIEKYLPAASTCSFNIGGWLENSQGLGSDLTLYFGEYDLTLSGVADANRIKLISADADNLRFQTLESGNLKINVSKLESPASVYKYFSANLDCRNEYSQGLLYFVVLTLVISLIYLLTYGIQLTYRLLSIRR